MISFSHIPAGIIDLTEVQVNGMGTYGYTSKWMLKQSEPIRNINNLVWWMTTKKAAKTIFFARVCTPPETYGYLYAGWCK